MPTTELFFVDSASVTKRVSKFSAQFYQYKTQISAGNIDRMPRVPVDAAHSAVTAHRRSGKAATEHKTPPTRTSPPCLAKAISATTRSTGLACSGASFGAALARSSMGLASASGSNLNPLVGVADVAGCRTSAVRGERG